MPASITLAGLAWSTPDGRPLFKDLNLSFGPERVGLVGRNGVGKTTLLRLIAGELAPQMGSVSVEGRVGVLRQAVQGPEAETIGDLFGVAEALARLARIEAGQGDEEDLAEADWTLEPRLRTALAAAGLEAEPEARLAALSGGQRTRAGLAALVFAAPDLLILDEPTNHLDAEGRTAVAELLAGWRGGALVVSHDRQLLEQMDAIVELSSLGAARYGGPWSHYRARRAEELAAAEQDLAQAERRLDELARGAQATAERKARKDAAGRRTAARGGQPRIVLGGMKARSETTGGAQARLAERRREQAADEAAAARERIEILQSLAIALPPTGLAQGRAVLRLEGVTAGYPEGPPVIRDLTLQLTGPERVAVVGPNGSGKTTLLSLIAGRLAPWSGTVRMLTPFALLDQSAGLLDPATSIRDNYRRLNPEAGENACRAALAAFMFRADAALQRVGDLSGGQVLRAALACVTGGLAPPPLLILDEPTNHLDLDSIAAIEAALSAYDGALLVVSHDEAFLEAIGVTRRVVLGALSGASGEI